MTTASTPECALHGCTNRIPDDPRALYCHVNCRMQAHRIKRRDALALMRQGGDAMERGDKETWERLTREGMAILRGTPKVAPGRVGFLQLPDED